MLRQIVLPDLGRLYECTLSACCQLAASPNCTLHTAHCTPSQTARTHPRQIGVQPRTGPQGDCPLSLAKPNDTQLLWSPKQQQKSLRILPKLSSSSCLYPVLGILSTLSPYRWLRSSVRFSICIDSLNICQVVNYDFFISENSLLIQIVVYLFLICCLCNPPFLI